MRASLNTSDYLRNWESGKIAPLEQWGLGRGPLLAPWDYCAGQHADRRLGVQVDELHGGDGGWGEVAYWDLGHLWAAHNNAAHYATDCPVSGR